MRTRILIVIVVIFLSGLSVTAQPVKPMDGKSKADKWLEDLRRANKGKWDEKYLLTGPLRYMSAVATERLSNETGKNDCERASLLIAYPVAFDSYVKGSFEDMAATAAKAVKEFVGALSPPTTLVALIKELLKKGAEKLIKYFQELLAKEKAEVYVSKTTKSNCDIVMVSIWDKAKSSYEVVIYGDCKCTQQTTWTTREKIKLSTFEIRLKGTTYIDVNQKEELYLKVEKPNFFSVIADCDSCKTGGVAVTPAPPPKPPIETPNPPNPPPPTPTDPCKVPPPCDACKAVLDKLTVACKERKEHDDWLANLRTQLTPALDRFNIFTRQLARLRNEKAPAEAINVKAKELEMATNEVNEFNVKIKKSVDERMKVVTRIEAQSDELKVCVKERCGKTATGNNAVLGLDPCLVGEWVSQNSTDVGGASGKGNIKMKIERDGRVTIIYDGMNPAVFKNPVTGTVEQIKVWSGTATGRIAATDGVVILQHADATSKVMATFTQYGRTETKPSSMLGVVILPAPYLVKYQCEGNSVKFGINFFGDIIDGYIFTKR